MSVSAYRKNYLADKKPFFKHFHPKDVTITAVRTVAIQGLMIFNNYVAALELELEDSDDDSSDADDDDDDDAAKKKTAKPEFVAPSLEEFSAACTKSFAKSVSITTFLRSLEEVSLRCLRPQVVGKLIKGATFVSVVHTKTTLALVADGWLNYVCHLRCEQVSDPQVHAHNEPLHCCNADGQDRHAREHPEPLCHLPR